MKSASCLPRDSHLPRRPSGRSAGPTLRAANPPGRRNCRRRDAECFPSASRRAELPPAAWLTRGARFRRRSLALGRWRWNGLSGRRSAAARLPPAPALSPWASRPSASAASCAAARPASAWSASGGSARRGDSLPSSSSSSSSLLRFCPQFLRGGLCAPLGTASWLRDLARGLGFGLRSRSGSGSGSRSTAAPALRLGRAARCRGNRPRLPSAPVHVRGRPPARERSLVVGEEPVVLEHVESGERILVRQRLAESRLVETWTASAPETSPSSGDPPTSGSIAN